MGPVLSLAVQRGRALRYFRVDVRRWTQHELARRARVGVNTIGRLESRGMRDRAVYVQVRRALGVSEAEVEAWMRARPVDRRLWPLVAWFERLGEPEKHLVGQVLALLDQALDQAHRVE